MRIDLNTYIAQKEYVLDWFNTKGNKDVNRTISMMASYRSIPCIVTAYWLGPETNWSSEVLGSIKTLVHFYGYTTIDGKPEDSPV